MQNLSDVFGRQKKAPYLSIRSMFLNCPKSLTGFGWLVGGQYATADLIALDRLKQRLEVALAKPIIAFALDELEKHRAHQGFREDLQQQALVTFDG